MVYILIVTMFNAKGDMARMEITTRSRLECAYKAERYLMRGIEAVCIGRVSM